MKIRGKKALQKLVYFCREAGVPVYATYRLHIYGPYSNEVAEEVAEAVDKEILRLDFDGVTFTAGTSCSNYLDRHRQATEPYRESLHFIASALSEAYGAVGEERVVAEVYRAKGLKFSHAQIREAYRSLVQWGWLGPRGTTEGAPAVL
ncbi:MAG: hypothetical protein H5U00_12055 [Clostridia bacterium]|nr:hypothetical protein [Clostridia bacterium]